MPALARAADDDQPIKALFVCGGCCHDYKNQKKIIPEGISKLANVEWTIAYQPETDTRTLNSVYKNPDWAKGFDVIVHDECSADVKILSEIDNILKPHKEGLPGVVLHCGMHCYRSEGWPKTVTPWFEFTGLQTTGHGGVTLPIDLDFIDKESPITKGLEDWTTIKEELYNNIAGHVLETAHPLATGAQGKNKTVVAWTNLYNGTAKVYATTSGHNTEPCADPRYLQLVTRGLLWSVGKLDDAHMKPAKHIYMEGAEPKDEPAKGAKAAGAAPAGPKADANGMVPLDPGARKNRHRLVEPDK